MIFSCTKKVLDKVKKHKMVLNSKEDIGLYNWYVDMLIVERKNHFLFTNSKTLYSFYIYAGTQKELQNIELLFEDKLIGLLKKELNIELNSLKKVLPNDRSYAFVKTNNKSVLGFMNKFKNHLQAHFRIDEGRKNPMKENANYYLNEMLVGKSPYNSPKELMEMELRYLLNDG